MHRISLLCVVLVLAPLAAEAQTPAGKWLGVRSEQGGISCWLADRRSDGTYRIEFRIHTASGLRPHVEEGRWLSSHGYYATFVERVNGRRVDLGDRSLREIYEVEVLDDQQFVYVEIATRIRFRVTRLPESYVLPASCPDLT